jgi:hypothetical protein
MVLSSERDKDGLQSELECVDDAKTRGHFALLHDLTSCLRIADVSEFTAEGPVVLKEVKTRPDRRDPAQLRRINAVIDCLVSGQPLQQRGGQVSQLLQVPQQMKSAARDLEEIIALADRDGSAAVSLGEGRMATVTSTTSDAYVEDPSAVRVAFQEKLVKAAARAGLSAQDLARSWSTENAGKISTEAPHSIFPLSTRDCARIICDQVIIQSLFSRRAIAQALVAQGFTVHVRDTDNIDPEVEKNPVCMSATTRDCSVEITTANLRQMLNEFLDLRRWAEAIAYLSQSLPQLPIASITFSNERATWR